MKGRETLGQQVQTMMHQNPEVLYSLISLKKARHPGYSKGVLGQNNGGLTPIKETDNDPALSLGIQMVIESQHENHVFVHRERRQ